MTDKKLQKETFSTLKDIFSAGKWNGDEYSETDLDDMVKNFERLTAEDTNFKVPFKIDFFKEVKTADYHGGQPAVGWITKLKKEGKKLFALIENIPKTIKELIENKAYRQVSAEVRWNMKHGEERLRRVLVGVALLGVETPGVANLEEFAALYNLELNEAEEIRSYITENKEESMTQEEIKKLQDDKAAAELKAEESKQYVAKLEQEKKVAEDKAAAEAKKSQELADGQRKAEIKTFVEAKKVEGKILPAQEEQITKVFESLDDSVTVTFTNAEKKEEQKSIRKVFEEYINSLPKLVDFEAKSKAGEKEKQFQTKPEEEAGSKESQILAEKAKEYMLDKKCTYSEALIAVSREEQKK